MNKILIQSGDYILKSTIIMPALDTFLVGEADAILVPEKNILPIRGIGKDKLFCTNCDHILAHNVNKNNIQVSIKCPACGVINRF